MSNRPQDLPIVSAYYPDSMTWAFYMTPPKPSALLDRPAKIVIQPNPYFDPSWLHADEILKSRLADHFPAPGGDPNSEGENDAE